MLSIIKEFGKKWYLKFRGDGITRLDGATRM